MTLKEFKNIAIHEIDPVLAYLIQLCASTKIITFSGDLGAGKTTLIAKLVSLLGSTEPVSSPTFTLINEYQTKDGTSIYHTDWYRIENNGELYDIGMEEYINKPNDYLLIEWPAVGEAMLADFQRINVQIEHLPNARNYIITG